MLTISPRQSRCSMQVLADGFYTPVGWNIKTGVFYLSIAGSISSYLLSAFDSVLKVNAVLVRRAALTSQPHPVLPSRLISMMMMARNSLPRGSRVFTNSGTGSSARGTYSSLLQPTSLGRPQSSRVGGFLGQPQYRKRRDPSPQFNRLQPYRLGMASS